MKYWEYLWKFVYEKQTSSLLLFCFHFPHRWDVLVYANQNVENYWVYFRGIIDCGTDARQTVAVLHYEGAKNARSWVEDNDRLPNPYGDRPNKKVKEANNFSVLTDSNSQKHVLVPASLSLSPSASLIRIWFLYISCNNVYVYFLYISCNNIYVYFLHISCTHIYVYMITIDINTTVTNLTEKTSFLKSFGSI